MSNSQSPAKRFRERCAAYVLNALDAGEERAFEATLADADEEQRRIYGEMRAAAHQLASAIEPDDPPEKVLGQLIGQVKEGGDQSRTAPAVTQQKSAPENGKKESGYSRYSLALAASAVLTLLTLTLVFYIFTQHAAINEREARIAALQNELQQKEDMLSILEARTLNLVALSGLDVNPAGYGKVIWDPEKQQALLQVANLPSVPEGKDYQLWLINNNQPVPAGVFDVDNPAGASFFKIEKLTGGDDSSVSAFAVTLEPDGGSQQPTGAMYLLGNVQSNANGDAN